MRVLNRLQVCRVAQWGRFLVQQNAQTEFIDLSIRRRTGSLRGLFVPRGRPRMIQFSVLAPTCNPALRSLGCGANCHLRMAWFPRQ